ncbi:group I truncated hemoglobin [Staphylospora marina]|uniref:group I truncated hemoglobin n=1 Tax=Staphylospora marina TaxID=2490858 RepID=UPI0019D0C260|nr:group 1 truncated hemoglobin [Staphylospora marina]
MQYPYELDDNLFEKLGGEEAVRAVVNEFYDRVLNDSRVSGIFDGVDMNILRSHQTIFMSFMLGSPVKFEGKTLREAHKGLGITSEEYEIILDHLNGALKKFNVGIEERAKILAFVRTLKPFIMGQ